MSNSAQEIHEILKKVTALEKQIATITRGHKHGDHVVLGHTTHPKETRTTVKGIGAWMSDLIDEGYLDTPKLVSEVEQKLKQDGHFYRNSVVATKLLRMVKSRLLTRIQEKGIWKYVKRT